MQKTSKRHHISKAKIRKTPMPKGQHQASKLEQKQYDEFVMNAYKLLYDAGLLGQTVKRLRSFIALGLAMDGLARVTLDIVDHLWLDLTKRDLHLADGVIFHAGAEILAEIADLSERHGVYIYTEEEIEGAFYKAIDLFMAQHQGSPPIDPAKKQEDAEFVHHIDENNLWEDYAPGMEAMLKEKLKDLGQSINRPQPIPAKKARMRRPSPKPHTQSAGQKRGSHV